MVGMAMKKRSRLIVSPWLAADWSQLHVDVEGAMSQEREMMAQEA